MVLLLFCQWRVARATHSHPPVGDTRHSPWPNSLPSSIAQEELKSWTAVMVNMATLLDSHDEVGKDHSLGSSPESL